MKKLFGLLLFTIQFLWTGCRTGTKEIEYGSNGGRLVSILNTKIYYEEYGQGIPLLLLSGGGINRSIKDFEKCIPGFSQQYRVIAPDTPGQGRSEQPDSLSYEMLTSYMSRLIDTLALDSAYVIGWSDGGVVGLLLAAKRPDKIKRVVAVGPNNGLKGALPPGYSAMPLPLDEWEKYNRESIAKYMKTLQRDWKKMVNDLNRMWYQEEYFSKSVYDSIKAPVMIVLGDRDDIRTEHGLEMHRLIRNSQFCVLPNTTHEVFSEKPGLINEVAMNFFKE